MREHDPFIIDSISEVWQGIISETVKQGKIKQLRSHFWIKTRRNQISQWSVQTLDTTSYQSKQFTSLVIVVKTLSQWS